MIDPYQNLLKIISSFRPVNEQYTFFHKMDVVGAWNWVPARAIWTKRLYYIFVIIRVVDGRFISSSGLEQNDDVDDKGGWCQVSTSFPIFLKIFVQCWFDLIHIWNVLKIITSPGSYIINIYFSCRIDVGVGLKREWGSRKI